MKTILPVAVTEEILISSSLPEDDAPTYDPNAVYVVGGTCIEGHKVYSSLVASNAGKLPSQHLTGSTPAWSLIGYTNRWRKYDEYVNSKSVSTDGSDMVDVLDLPYCNGLALFGLVGETVTITVANAQGDIVYEQTASLLTESVQNWEDFFYASRHWQEVCWVEFPIMTRAIVTIRISGATPTCGMAIPGEVKELGATQYDASLPTTDYSIFSVNDFGGISLSEGAYTQGVEGDVTVETTLLAATKRIAAQLRATPTAFFCANEVHADGLSDVMIAYGVLRSFEATIARPTEQDISFKIVGVK